jgi:hypothetical protein
MDTLLRGLLIGAVATVPQSLTILAGRQLHLLRTPPPVQITERSLEAVGLEPDRADPAFAATTVALHFGYGAACGGLYALARPVLPGNPWIGGVAFGLAVWGGSYYGLMPALDLYPPPDRDTSGRIATMIAAHVVFGAALAAFDRMFPADASPAG